MATNNCDNCVSLLTCLTQVKDTLSAKEARIRYLQTLITEMKIEMTTCKMESIHMLRTKALERYQQEYIEKYGVGKDMVDDGMVQDGYDTVG